MTSEEEQIFMDANGRLEVVRDHAVALGRPELALEIESVRLKFQIELNKRKIAEMDRA